MKIKGMFMRGRVARRIFVLFVLSAFVPALALAVLTLSQVRAVLTEQSRAQLIETSQAYALTVYERLLMAQGSLARIALGLHDGVAPTGRALQTLEGTYTALSVVGPDARPSALMGKTLAWPEIGEAGRTHLAKGESVLVAEPGSGAIPRVLLLQMIDANRSDNFALAAELNLAQLWGAPDSFPYMVDLCMLAETGAVLFCSQPELLADSPELRRKVAESSPDPRVQVGEEPRIMGHWQLFLKPKFFAPYWTAIALQPTSAALAPVTKFSRIFIGVVVLALLLVALLSVSQIRRTMGPLAQLIKGTRCVADEDFDHRVAVASRDEFGELASSFNDMAARLGRQLGALKVLSGIDQVILSKLDMDPVFHMVLARIRELTSAGFAGIVVLEAASAGEARVYFLRGGHDGNLEMSRIRLDPQALQELDDRQGGFWLDDAGSLRRSLPCLAFQNSRRVFILPILAAGKLCAFGCLDLAEAGDLPQDVLAHLTDLGDRVGVALSAAARDEQLIYQARHDDLTGLPNRLLFKERLSREIAFAQRESRNLALLYIDLDRFKSINDSLGHSAGDQLLEQAAQRLRRCIRESDTVARLGGDEFAIVLPSIAGVRSATTVAEHILVAFSESFAVAGQECYVSASIGITISPVDGNDSEELLRKADTAMYRAKDGGGGRFVYFEEQMNIEAIERMTLEREMREALLRDEFVLHYQPQLDLRTGRIAGAEALLRWNHPTRGLVAPGVFIGAAEETGLIEEIGRRVIFGACVQHAAWRAAGGRPPRIAINVSGRQFRRGDLVQLVGDALRKTATPASALEIEVTESLFLDESTNALATLDQLRRMGLKVAIDDFGTGYSSMAYLKRLPVDVLKIDRSFITDLVADDDARVIAEVIITLAHALRKSVVAEGVETVDQLDLLRSWGCDTIQGYYFSRPLAPERFVALMQQQSMDGAPNDLGASGVASAEQGAVLAP